MRVPTSSTIFGYPGLALVLFLTAAAGGFWMAVDDPGGRRPEDPMKSRPRILSASSLTPPSTGVASSAASSAPRSIPLRCIVEARVAKANAAPTQGTIRVSLIMQTSGATYVPRLLPLVEADSRVAPISRRGRSAVEADLQVGLLVSRSSLGRGDVNQLGMRGDVFSDDRLGLRHRISIAGAEDCVGVDEILLVCGGRVGAVVNRGDGTRGDAGATIDALFGMNEEHGRRFELGFILARMDAVDRAHIHTRAVLGADAGVGDDEGHCA